MSESKQKPVVNAPNKPEQSKVDDDKKRLAQITEANRILKDAQKTEANKAAEAEQKLDAEVAKLKAENASLKEANAKLEADKELLLTTPLPPSKSDEALKLAAENKKLSQALVKEQKNVEKLNEKREKDLAAQKEILQTRAATALEKEKQRRKDAVAKEKTKAANEQAELVKAHQAELAAVKEAAEKAQKAQKELEKRAAAVEKAALVDNAQVREASEELAKLQDQTALQARRITTLEKLHKEALAKEQKAREQAVAAEKKAAQEKLAALKAQITAAEAERIRLEGELERTKTEGRRLQNEFDSKLLKQKSEIVALEAKIQQLEIELAAKPKVVVEKPQQPAQDYLLTKLEVELAQLADVVSAAEAGMPVRYHRSVDPVLEGYTAEPRYEREPLGEEAEDEEYVFEEIPTREYIAAYDEEYLGKKAKLEFQRERIRIKYEKILDNANKELTQNMNDQEKMYNRIEEINREVIAINEKLAAADKDFEQGDRRELEAKRSNLFLERDARKQQLTRLQQEERPAIEERRDKALAEMDEEIKRQVAIEENLLDDYVKIYESNGIPAARKAAPASAPEPAPIAEPVAPAAPVAPSAPENVPEVNEQKAAAKAKIADEMVSLQNSRKVREYLKLRNEQQPFLAERKETERQIASYQGMGTPAEKEERKLLAASLKAAEKRHKELDKKVESYEKQLTKLAKNDKVQSYLQLEADQAELDGPAEG